MALLLNDEASEYWESDTSNLQVTGYPATIACWVLYDETAVDTYIAATLQNNAATSDFLRLGMNASSQAVARRRSTAVGFEDAVYTASSLSQDTWHHIAAVFTNATTHVVYLDGSSAAAGATSITPAGINVLMLGSWNDTPANFWSGGLAEVGVWSGAKTSGDITNLSTNKWAPEKISADLEHYFRLTTVGDDTDRAGSLTWATQVGGATTTHPAGIQYNEVASAGVVVGGAPAIGFRRHSIVVPY